MGKHHREILAIPQIARELCKNQSLPNTARTKKPAMEVAVPMPPGAMNYLQNWLCYLNNMDKRQEEKTENDTKLTSWIN